ncbi:MAG: DNA repair protein RecO [Anaerolineaceae bacterium]|nr:DNA repair protein RecO [Anaerolineaceae bacterium]
MPRQERTFRTQAIILKRRDFGEADRLLTILTPEHGKLSVIAKGARKPTSHKSGHVELFTQVDMLIQRGRDLDIVTQAEMGKPYLELREDLSRGAYASYVAELLDRFTGADDDDFPGLFQLLDDTLNRLCTDSDPRRAVRYYEIRLLDMVGFRPELNICAISQEPIQAEDQFFSYALGGVVSPTAAQINAGLTPVTMLTLKFLRHMQRSPYSHVQSLTVTPELHDETERLMLGYLTYLLERKLQSVDFIRRIRRQ